MDVSNDVVIRSRSGQLLDVGRRYAGLGARLAGELVPQQSGNSYRILGELFDCRHEMLGNKGIRRIERGVDCLVMDNTFSLCPCLLSLLSIRRIAGISITSPRIAEHKRILFSTGVVQIGFPPRKIKTSPSLSRSIRQSPSPRETPQGPSPSGVYLAGERA